MGSFLSNTPDELARELGDQNRRIEEDQTQRIAQIQHLPYLDMQSFPLDLNSMALISKEQALQSESAPFFKEGKDLKVATINPSNQLLNTILTELKTHYSVTLYLISKSSFKHLIRFYDKVIIPTSKFSETINLDESIDYTNQLTSLPEKTNISDILAILFGSAIAQGSSDIHIEPEDHLVKIRFRIDGVLHDAVLLPKAMQAQITSRLKLMAKLKFNVTNEPQDGRTSLTRGSQQIDVRVSTLPSSYGEAFVLRLLGVGTVGLKIAELGLNGKALQIIEDQLHKPNGMIITTGPTGSGKTTTLYSFLEELNEPGVKIITLEDPVEYKVEGIQQTPIDHRVDFSFVKALRAVLRQDPDVVMVGEIRDPETAETALQAALTGHIVLSTLHTNNAAGAVPRLLTMGVKPFIIAPAINAIIAQRLVRRLCPDCIKEDNLDQLVLEKVHKSLNNIPANSGVVVPQDLKFYTSSGCKSCNNLGYKGRVGIYEVIEVTDVIRELIQKEPSIITIAKAAYDQGTVTMEQDGLLKALQKITDVAEVFRVAG